MTYFLQKIEFEKMNKEYPNQRHAELLVSYEFTYADALDIVIIDCIEKNLLDEEAILKASLDVAQILKKSDISESLQKAWSLYHDSFRDNADEVCTAIQSALENGLQYLEPIEFGQSISLLLDLGAVEMGRKLLREYVDLNSENLKGVSRTHVSMGVKYHSEVFDAFHAISEGGSVPPKIEDSLERLYKGEWHPQDVEACEALSEDDFYRLFKEAGSDKHAVIVGGALSMMTVSNPPSGLSGMAEKAKAALWKISSENLINKRRIEGRIGPAPEA